MKIFGLALLLATCVAAASRPALSQDAEKKGAGNKMYAIPSWGDMTLVYGPGTDPAMDSEPAMENMFRYWKGRGFSGVFLRSDLQQVEPFVRRNPREQMNPALALLWQDIDVQAKTHDYYKSAQQAADKTGFEFWAYHPHIFSNGAPEGVGEDGPGRMVPWSYVDKYMYEHPETVVVDRKGHKYWMVPEYAYPGMRASKVSEFVYLAKTYGIKRFLLSLRSEVSQIMDNAAHADQYGFNKPVADDMKRLYDVDIMTDPRFDVDSPNFKLDDPMVQKWRDLRGTYFTQLLRDLRKGLSAVDPNIQIAITFSGEFAGPPLGNWRMDWRTWVDEGLVDMLVTPVFFEASLDPDADKKGYLTHARLGVGTVPLKTMHDTIAKSKHPEIKIIQTGGPYYQFTAPPAGADGWQTDVWYSSYHKAWQQRWDQWMRDVKDFGAIKFLDQNFDTVSPRDFTGAAGSWGGVTYDPKLRACPGGWWRLGDGASTRPFAQSVVKRGATGQAIQLTSGPDSSLTGWHMAGPDRSTFSGSVDSTITNGVATLDFWVQRKTADSAFNVSLQGDGTERDMALRVAPTTGKISYSTGAAVGGGYAWKETEYSVPVGSWQKLTMRVDIDRAVYSAFMGDSRPVTIGKDVPLTIPKERIMDQIGTNLRIKVPVFKQIKQVVFAPEGAAGSTLFLDDVSLNWKPTLYFAPRGTTVAFADDFEKRTLDADFGSKAVTAGWKLPADAPSNGFFITNDTSYGAGVKALQSRGDAKIMAIPAKKLNLKAPLNLDMDMFLLSSKTAYNMIPNPTLTAPHRTVVGLADEKSGAWLAAVQGGDVNWQIWDGNAWKDSGVRFDYDAWNHVQIALDGKGGYKVVVQPVGQMPIFAGTAKTGAMPNASTPVLMIDPLKTEDHVSLYDNVLHNFRRAGSARSRVCAIKRRYAMFLKLRRLMLAIFPARSLFKQLRHRLRAQPQPLVWSPPPKNVSVSVFQSRQSNNIRGDLVPLSSPPAIDEAFDAAQKSFGATRVLWRGLQEEDYVRHQQFRPDNIWLYDVWQWSRRLSLDLKLNTHAVKAAHRRGMKIWGLTSLFEYGAEPREAVYTAMEYGPAVSEDRLRINHREWNPMDRHGIRRQTGPLEFAYPEARRALCDQLTGEVLRHDYDGLMLVTYIENTDLWFEDEFGFSPPIVREFKRRYGVDIRTQPFDVQAWRDLRGEYVTQFLRELSATLHARGKKLGVAVDPKRPERAQPWAGNPNVSNAGSLKMDWRRWIREGIVDEIMVGSPDGSEAFAAQVAQVQPKSATNFSILSHPQAPRKTLSAPLPSGWTPIVSASVPAFETDIAPPTLGVLARRRHIRALAARGATALPELEALLHDEDHATRVAAVVALGKVYSGSTPSRIYEATAKYGNAQFNYEAAQSLSKMKDAATPAIIAGLNSRVLAVRRLAVEALRAGELRPQAMPRLLVTLRDEDSWVRWAATLSIGRLGAQDASNRALAMRALLAQMNDAHPTVRAAAAGALGDLFSGGSGDAESRTRVLATLSARFAEYGKNYRGADAEWGFKTPGRALQKWGEGGEAVLQKYLQSDDAVLSDHAWRALYLPPSSLGAAAKDLESAQPFYNLHPLGRALAR